MNIKEIAEYIWIREIDRQSSVRRICITGDGGAGKTSLAKEILNLSKYDAEMLEIDEFAIPRSIRKQRGLNGYSPASFNFNEFRDCCSNLLLNVSVFTPHYSHSNGRSCRDKECLIESHSHHRGKKLY